MNSNNKQYGYANDPNVLYGAHYATLVSDSVSFESPTGEFILSYATPHMPTDKKSEKTTPKTNSSNLVNKNDKLGDGNITISNTVKLTVPRYMFYIMNSYIVANRTPCVHHLAAAARNGVHNAVEKTGNQLNSIIDKATTTAAGISSKSAGGIAPAAASVINTGLVLSGLIGEKSATVAIEQAATIAGISKKADDMKGEASSSAQKAIQKMNSPIATKIASVLGSIGTIYKDANKAMKISKAASMASMVEIILLAIAAGVEISKITEIIGVPGPPAVKANQTAGAEAGKVPATKASEKAAAAAAGSSPAQIIKMLSEETKKAMDIAKSVGDTAKKLASAVGANSVSTIVDTGLNYADQAASYVQKGTGIATEINKFAKTVSSDSADAVSLVSAAGGCAAEVAGALGASTIASTALYAGSSATTVVSAIQDAVKGTSMTTDTANAASMAAGSSAEMSGWECAQMIISSVIELAQNTGILSSDTAKLAGATTGLINKAIDIVKDKAVKDEEAKTAGEEAAKKAKEEGKSEEEQAQAAAEAAAAKMKELGGDDIDVARGVGTAIDMIYTSFGYMGDERLANVKNMADTVLSLPGMVEDIKKMVGYSTAPIAASVAADKTKGSSTAKGKAAGEEAAKVMNEAGATPEEAASVGGDSAGVETGKAGGTAEEATQTAGDVAYQTRYNLDTMVLPEQREQNAKTSQANAAATTSAEIQVTTKKIENDINDNKDELMEKAKEAASEYAKSASKNPSCSGIGTISPVSVPHRKVYRKGQKFVIMNAGGRVDSPCIISVVETDSNITDKLI